MIINEKKIPNDVLKWIEQNNDEILLTRVTKTLKKIQPKSVVTFSDNSWEFTNFYTLLGFSKVSTGTPSYFYIDRYNFDGRINRLNMQKHLLVSRGAPEYLTESEIATTMGLSRVWDCGHTKWIWK